MNWINVTDNSPIELLTRCAEIYTNTHNHAQVPQCLAVEKLSKLLAYSPNKSEQDKFNRFAYAEGDIRRVLFVRAGIGDGDGVVVALFFNRTLRRTPPYRRTLDGGAHGPFWNLSICCEVNPTQEICAEVVAECTRFREEVSHDEPLLMFEGNVNGPVDEIVAQLDNTGHILGPETPPYIMLAQYQSFLPWWRWGQPIGGSGNRKVPFLALQF